MATAAKQEMIVPVITHSFGWRDKESQKSLQVLFDQYLAEEADTNAAKYKDHHEISFHFLDQKGLRLDSPAWDRYFTAINDYTSPCPVVLVFAGDNDICDKDHNLMKDGDTVFFMVKDRMLDILHKCPEVKQVYWSCLFARGPNPAYGEYNRQAADFNDNAKEHNKTVYGKNRNSLQFMSVDSELVPKHDKKEDRLLFTTEHLLKDNVHPNPKHSLYQKVFLVSQAPDISGCV